jgi:hypothetical protein
VQVAHQALQSLHAVAVAEPDRLREHVLGHQGGGLRHLLLVGRFLVGDGLDASQSAPLVLEVFRAALSSYRSCCAAARSKRTTDRTDSPPESRRGRQSGVSTFLPFFNCISLSG